MDYEKKYKDALEKAREIYKEDFKAMWLENLFPELKESEDEKIRKAIHIYLDWLDGKNKDYQPKGKYTIRDMIAWLEKQAEPQPYKGNADTMRKNLIRAFKSVGSNHWGGFNVKDILYFLESKEAVELERQDKSNPYSGVSFEYNGHTWGMCARDNGVDILLDKQIFKHLEKQGEQQKTKTDLIMWKPVSEYKGGRVLATNDVDILVGYINSDGDCESEDCEGTLLCGITGFVEIEDVLPPKQGENKPADKIEPRFKVGDWIVYETEGWREVLQIDTIDERYTFTNGSSSSFDEEQYMRLWTIEDARDGDVLANKNGAIFINAGDSKERGTFDCYCYLSVQNKFCIEEHKTGSWFYKDDIKPATKEQRELLFSKMKEAGYEWDTEKKELKKIEKIDEKYKVGKYFTGLIPCWVNAPSTLQPAHNYHGKNIVAIHSKDGGYRCCCIDDKKPVAFSLPENTPLVEGWKRKSAEWSDEDEKIIETMCKEGDLRPSQMIWLKSLKDRVQPHWKPTDEQMEDLKYAINMVDKCCEDSLQSLYNDLKKL